MIARRRTRREARARSVREDFLNFVGEEATVCLSSSSDIVLWLMASYVMLQGPFEWRDCFLPLGVSPWQVGQMQARFRTGDKPGRRRGVMKEGCLV